MTDREQHSFGESAVTSTHSSTCISKAQPCETRMFKDAILDSLAVLGNVAQFVSFGPDGVQRFCRIAGHPANHVFASAEEAVAALLAMSPEGTVNVRSFRPERAQGNPFIYGLGTLADVLASVRQLTQDGFHVIVNETVDVNDGGVSGVLQHNCMEFAPGVVPRFVEKSGVDPVPALPRDLAEKMLETVYGFCPDLARYPKGNECDKERGAEVGDYRVEFSMHPSARGFRHERTIIWEEERLEKTPITPFYAWPNPFSRLLGDKAYGLLLGWLLGAPVPRCTVFPRDVKVSPFTFGTPTGTGARWTRTCPKQQEPGRFSTLRSWVDPFALMQQEDPENLYLASCLVQDEVRAQFSGALITSAENMPIIEGIHGFGDDFMLGIDQPKSVLPQNVLHDVQTLYASLCEKLHGAVRFEWAHDGRQLWLLQLHKGSTNSCGRIIVPGTPAIWMDFQVAQGLQALHQLVATAKQRGNGIRVMGNVGMSSHMADILRKAQVPSELVSQ